MSLDCSAKPLFSDGTHTGAGITCSFPHREALARLRVGHGTISLWGGGVNHCLARRCWHSKRPTGRSCVRRKLTSVEALSRRRSKRTSLKRRGEKKKSLFSYEFNQILTATYFVHCLAIFSNLVVAAVKWACFGLRLVAAKRPRRTLVCAVSRETAQKDFPSGYRWRETAQKISTCPHGQTKHCGLRVMVAFTWNDAVDQHWESLRANWKQLRGAPASADCGIEYFLFFFFFFFSYCVVTRRFPGRPPAFPRGLRGCGPR